MTRESNELISDKGQTPAGGVRYVTSEKTFVELKKIAGPLGLLTALMIFQQLELPSEIFNSARVKVDLTIKRTRLVEQILSDKDSINLEHLIKSELRSYEGAIRRAAQEGFLISSITDIGSPEDLQDEDVREVSSVVTERWSILQAIFFASTVLTTIGYGNVVPSTEWGRVFCIFYAFIGIPLTLTAIAAWGKLFAEAVNNIADKLGRKLPAFLTRLIPSNNTGRRSLGALAAIVLLFVYLSCGAAMFVIWEDDWNFFDGFYFWFVTMTTIGFGDLVPKKPKYMLLCSLYILVGLALTGTIIELVRMQYNQSWQRLQALRGPLVEALKKLGEQAGGDVSALQLDLKKILAVASLPKFRRPNDSERAHAEWEEAVQAVLKEIEASTSQNENKKIVRIIIYESSV
ncbi:potassium channel subfamily K member 1-like isoform X2 [Diachasmimorpha longicaudata]|uniref:potassium channel subfamily K member 1-like isoform X2 n=1 Tax=Diachasmimorpha longicaudata TaxID=58733 RepID=UPI0030B8724F